uniref:DNA-binding protein D-ETS-4 n=1 Tax=Bactrocera dorsalis TaxID=27457 RepID=A0A034W792_BACDO
MENEKMSTFYSSSNKLTQSNCLVPPTTVPHLQLTPSTIHTTTPMQSSAQLSLSLKVEQAQVSANAFLEPSNATASLSSSASSSTAYNDPFAAYAENFDLSLLPQDCAQTNANIPTIVYQFGCNTPTTPTTTPVLSPNAVPFHNLLTPPQIKVEQAWSFGSTISLPEEIKREPQSQPMLKSANQLIPPPPYPHIYPSPQSSPAQSKYGFPPTQFASCFESQSSSLSSSRSSLHPSSPYPSLDACNIKQELHILPPSPPESNCEAPSPHSSWADIKSEPLDADVETLIDLKMLLDKKEFSNTAYNDYNSNSSECQLKPSAAMPVQQQQHQHQQQQQQKSQDHQMLREFFEENHFPMGCSMNEVGGNIEQVISMALEDTKSQAVETCAKLQISQDPCDWSVSQAHSWLRSTVAQFKLPEIEDLEAKFPENGAALILLSEEEFKRRVPESGSDLYAQLEVWRYHFNSNAAESDDDEDMLPTTSALAVAGTTTTTTAKSTDTKRTGRSGGSHIHLWQFLKELLAEPHAHGTAIRWIDRNRGIFKIEDSVRVAKLWGGRKNRPAMNYDKLSRSIRQYYKKGIMKKTERSQRLVYQFCHPYQL